MRNNGNGTNHKPTEKKGIPVTKCPPGVAQGALDFFRIQFDPKLGLPRNQLPLTYCFRAFAKTY